MNRTFTALLLIASACMAGALPAHGQATRPDILILSPEAGERVPIDAVLIALSLNSDVVDASTITLEVDGNAVGTGLELTGDVLTWKPVSRFEPGPHRVVIKARNKSGAEIEPVSWIFTVAPVPAITPGAPSTAQSGIGRGARMHGSLIIEGSGNSVSGAGAAFSRQEDFLPRAWLNVGGILGPGWSYNARVHASGYESSLEQPVNRYRAELRAPFFSVAVGDVNPFYQTLILSGLRVRGVQGDVKAGALRLSAVTGKTRRAIPGILGLATPETVVRTGTFGQDMFAFRPAIGSGNKFQVGATFMRMHDDLGSIPDLRLGFTGGTSRPPNPPPKDNVVGGLDFTLRMFGGRMLVQYENAVSLLTNDASGGQITKAGLDSLLESYNAEPSDIDPEDFADFFTMNASLIPINPSDLSNLAQQMRASVNAGTHQLAFEVRSIGGSYYTLGNPGMERDLRGFRIRDSFTLLQNALVMSLAYEQDNDNLDNTRAAATTSTGAYATASWQKSRDAVLLNASARLGSRSNDLAAGSFDARDESNQAFSGGISVPVPVISALRTRVTFNTSFIKREDALNTAFDTRDIYYLGGLQAESRDQLSQYGLLYGVNRAELTSVTGARTDFTRLLATVRQRLNQRFTALLDATRTSASSDATANAFGLRYSRNELMGGGEYTHTAAAVVTLTGGVVAYDDERAPGNNTSEVLVRLRMSRAF